MPDLLPFRGPQGYIRNPQAADASDYAYGTDHPIWEGHYRGNAQALNRFQVYGSADIAESFEWSQVEEVYDRLLQIHDLNLDTQGKVDDRAQGALRQEQINAQEGHIQVPVNCGQELYDVIAVTDGRAGLSAAKRRVVGLSLDYNQRNRVSYRLRLSLGGV